MKLCKDCKWYAENDDSSHDLCMHKRSSEGASVYWVRGEGAPKNYSCYAMRAGICGVSADLFEPRESA